MEVKLFYKGKVRNLYEVNDCFILQATDRISAFDVVFDQQNLPNKGSLLTKISNHWFSVFKECPNHLIKTDYTQFPPPYNVPSFKDNSVLVKKANRIDYECIVRGYLMGSGYKEYLKSQSVCGVPLPAELHLAQKLPSPIFTPTTKVDQGHDENISLEDMQADIGKDLAEQLKSISLNIYNKAHAKLLEQNILLMDTKFEFGLIDNQLCLIDELLTPDSSRFCDKKEYEEAITNKQTPPSMDKQIVRNYLETLSWNKKSPAPKLPKEIIDQTVSKYQEIYDKVIKIPV